MVRPSLLLCVLAAAAASFAGGCCCSPCLRLPCINELDRHYPGSDDCLNGGPCGDPEDVGGMQTGMSNCETCAPQRQLTSCSSCSTGCSGCGEWFPWTKGFTGGGCGRFYWDEWWSDPPCKCEPCDLNGNYCGGQGICRSWRLGLPMPMLSRNCCGANPACCGGSSLSCWAKNRKTCWTGCFSPCRSNCSTGCCTSGSCHIDSVGYDASHDATCSSCQKGGTMMTTPAEPTAPTPAPVPAPAPAPTQTTVMPPARLAPAVANRPHAKTVSSKGRYAPAKTTVTRRG
jgi:hypothetical protein